MNLKQHLIQQTSQLDALLVLLESEQVLLGDGSIKGEDLQGVAEKKMQCLQAIEESEQTRQRIVEKMGFTNSLAGVRNAAEYADCTMEWQQLLEQAQRVAQLNNLNGDLIQHRLYHNQQMLNILRDANSANGPGVYSPDGSQSKRVYRLNSQA